MVYKPLVELSNPGASGSVFYLTEDDEFIVKTVQHKEADFLQKLLPGYYMVRLMEKVCVCVGRGGCQTKIHNITCHTCYIILLSHNSDPFVT